MELDLMGVVGPHVLTHSGIYLDLLHPHHELIHGDDIGHALSMLCRFTGHTSRFYSVAEHSVHCSRLVPPEHQLQALLHDGAEAYIGDVSTPLKGLLPDYKRISKAVECAVMRAYMLPETLSDEVRAADLQMLGVERDALMPGIGEWACLEGVYRPAIELQCWSPADAKTAFMDRLDEVIHQAMSPVA